VGDIFLLCSMASLNKLELESEEDDLLRLNDTPGFLSAALLSTDESDFFSSTFVVVVGFAGVVVGLAGVVVGLDMAIGLAGVVGLAGVSLDMPREVDGLAGVVGVGFVMLFVAGLEVVLVDGFAGVVVLVIVGFTGVLDVVLGFSGALVSSALTPAFSQAALYISNSFSLAFNSFSLSLTSLSFSLANV